MLTAPSEAGVLPDLVIGTSVGAVNGAWVAGASHPAELGAVRRSLRRDAVFPARPLRGLLEFIGTRCHLVPDSGIRRLLCDHLHLDRLEDSPIPFHVVATTSSGAATRCSPAAKASTRSWPVPQSWASWRPCGSPGGISSTAGWQRRRWHNHHRSPICDTVGLAHRFSASGLSDRRIPRAPGRLPLPPVA